MLDSIKQKFADLAQNDPLKLRLLTLAPKSWTVRKTASEFNTTTYMAHKAILLRQKSGIFAETTVRSSCCLPDATKHIVESFYENDENSRIMPGKKDVISVKVDGKRILFQKRLLLFDLKSLFALFQEKNPNLKIGLSTFAKLRPKYCIFAGASGTHNVCVCTIHENCKLMLDAISIEKITADSTMKLTNYRDCISHMVCDKPSEKCYLNDCQNCVNSDQLYSHLRNVLDKNFVQMVEFSIWTGTDRCTLLTSKMQIDDFLEELFQKLLVLKSHSFITKKQHEFVNMLLADLRENQVVVKWDFSENYAFIAQNAAQAFHFNNDQSTVFSVIFYYKEKSELKKKSLIFISESRKHDTAAVHTIQTLLIPKILKVVKHPVKKIFYVSDGAKQHFKNRYQMINLMHHKSDFNIDAEWHFHATAHGKDEIDGIAANYKRCAAKASLIAKPNDAILTVKKLHEWSKDGFGKSDVIYYSEQEHQRCQRQLNKRFSNAPLVKNIMSNHGFIPHSNKILYLKRFSASAEFQTFKYN